MGISMGKIRHGRYIGLKMNQSFNHSIKMCKCVQYTQIDKCTIIRKYLIANLRFIPASFSRSWYCFLLCFLMFVCCLTFCLRVFGFHEYATIDGEWLQNLGLRSLCREGLLSCHSCSDTRDSDLRSHLKNLPILISQIFQLMY